MCVLVAQSCLTLCNHMDCSPLDSSVHRILQARILEWVAIPVPSGSSQPRNRTPVSCLAGRFFILWAPREAQEVSTSKGFKVVVMGSGHKVAALLHTQVWLPGHPEP